MGYTTEFNGHFDLNKKLTDEDAQYLLKFANVRHMKRDIQGYGIEGEFYVDGSDNDGSDNFGQGRDSNIIDYNKPPSTQPGLWCQWVPTKDYKGIIWDEGEKFYNYVEWLEYIINNFLAPKGYILNGEVEWIGEENGDLGMIVVVDNVVTTKEGFVAYI